MHPEEDLLLLSVQVAAVTVLLLSEETVVNLAAYMTEEDQDLMWTLVAPVHQHTQVDGHQELLC